MSEGLGIGVSVTLFQDLEPAPTTWSESPLPEGWVVTELGHFIESMANGVYKPASAYADDGVLCLRMYNIRDGRIDVTGAKRMRLTSRETAQFELLPADILINRVNSRELVGKAAICAQFDEPTVFESKNIRLRLKPTTCQPEYVNLLLRTQSVRSLLTDSAKQTVGMATVSQPHLQHLRLPFAPLAEQKRIAAKVEAVLAKVNAARQRLAKVPAILKRFRQSVLAAACSGRLTEDWRDNHGNMQEHSAKQLVRSLESAHTSLGRGHGGKAADPSEDVHTLADADIPTSWEISELQLLCTPGRPITYGILKPGPPQTAGVCYVRVADFPKDRLNLSTIRKTTEQIANAYQRSALREGDVLLSIRGTVGRVCRVPSELAGANITQDTARISLHEGVCADFVVMCLKSPSAQERMKVATKGVAVRGINIGDVRVLQIPIAPLPEQLEIVRRVSALFARADKLEARLAAATAAVERVTQAVLAKAFRGELVETEASLARREGRDYEPAAKLLERVRASADAAPRKPQRRRSLRRQETAARRQSGRGDVV